MTKLIKSICSILRRLSRLVKRFDDENFARNNLRFAIINKLLVANVAKFGALITNLFQIANQRQVSKVSVGVAPRGNGKN